MKITSMALIEEESELQWDRKTNFAMAKIQMMDAMDKAIQLKEENRMLCKALEVARTESERDKKIIRELEKRNAYLQWQYDRIEDLEKRLDALENPRPTIHHNHGCQNFYGTISESDFSKNEIQQ